MKQKRNLSLSNVLLAAAALLTQAVPGARAAETFWTGGTGSYNNAASWSGGAIPGTNDTAINASGLNNTVQINNGDPDWAVRQILANNGSFVQNGQTLTLSATPRALRIGQTNGTQGVFTLNSGTLNYGGGLLNVGERGTGTLNVNGGTINASGTLAVTIGSTLDAVNATMDGGLGLGGHTWFERGFYLPDATRGLPAAGSLVVSETQADHSYTMPPTYSTNCSVFMGGGLSNATVTLISPTAANALSFLGSSGGGAATINYTIHFAGGAPNETGTLVLPDWYPPAEATVAVKVGGRVLATGLQFQNIDGAIDNPKLVSVDVTLANTTSQITSIDFAYVSGGRGGILAISRSSGAGFSPLAINGYNADIVLEANAPIYVANNITNVLNQTAGTIDITGEFWVGNVGAGVYNFTGGSNNFRNWFALGRSGGRGTMTMTSGILNKVGNGNFMIGTGYQATNGATPTGFFTHSGGTITSSGEFMIPENAPAKGTYNISGSAVLTVNNWMQVGRFGGEGLMNMTGGTITKGGGGNFIVGDNATGLLNQSAGTIEVNNEVWVGQSGSGNGTYNLSGGSITNHNWLAIGRGGGVGVINLTNGTIARVDGGNIAIGSGGNGTLNQYGGTIYNNPGTILYVAEASGTGTWEMNGGTANLGLLQFCQGGNGSGTLYFNGGLITASEINCGADGANGSIYLNGGTIQARGDNQNFFHGLSLATVQPGGVVFDSQGFEVTVSQALYDSGGGLTKIGAGKLTLTGGNTYSGPSAVNVGTLVVTTTSTANGDYNVANGAELDLNVLGANAQLNTANMNLASGTTTLGFDLGAFGNPVSAPWNVFGNLSVNGTVAVKITDALPQIGQIPLIQFGSRSGSGNFVIASLPVGVVANIVTNGNVIALNISNVNLPRWDGQAGGNWDIGLTTNWVNIGDNLPTYFGQGNAVEFNDAALGTTTVNLTTTVNPSKVLINNSSLPYAFSGAGRISGTGGLTKQGTGVAAITNAGGNNYTGPTVISGGTLSVNSLANGGAASSIGASSASPTNLVLNGGSLSYSGPATTINRGYSVSATGGAVETLGNLTVSGQTVAAPGGSFTKAGPAQLAYTGTGSNALSGGNYLLREGTVVLNGGAGPQTNTIPGAFSVAGAVNAVAILTNTTLNVNDNSLGNVADTFASMTLNTGSVLNVNSWFLLGDAANAVTTFTLNDGTVRIPNGRLFLCSAPGTTATLNINGGLISKSGDIIVVSDGGWNGSGTRTGTVNQVAGTLDSSSELWVAQTSPGVGIYNLSGGTINLRNWFVTGRNGGNGTFNMTGGTINRGGDGYHHFIVGDMSGSQGLFNFSGGTINNDKEFWVGQNVGVGVFNMTGGTFNQHDWVAIGRDGGNGTFNLQGGSITKDNNGDFLVAAGNGSIGVLNHSGGTITSSSSFLVPQWGNASTLGTYNLSSTGVCNVSSWVAVGRDGGAGVMNMSGGAFTKTGGGAFIIGASGLGTFNQTGGTLTNTVSDTWIAENNSGTWTISGGTAVLGWVQFARNGSGQGTLNLDGGVVSVSEIVGGAGWATNNYNGGTLKARANNANFLHDLDAANILAGGLILDTDTNTVGVAQALLGTGGLTKLGAGRLNLNGVNTYAGATLVNAGTLGGNGVINGPLTVSAAGSVAPGVSVGTLTVNNTVALGGSAVMEVSKNGGVPTSDLLAVSGSLGFGGTLKVVLTGTNALALNDTFNLFDWTTTSGSFTGVELPAGYFWDLSQLYVNGTIRVTGFSPPQLNPSTVANGKLVLTGIGGPAGSSYTWLTSTNAAAPIGEWTTNLTGVFDVTGAFSNAIPVNTSEPARFFRIKTP